jgi:hypothetical protein
MTSRRFYASLHTEGSWRNRPEDVDWVATLASSMEHFEAEEPGPAWYGAGHVVVIPTRDLDESAVWALWESPADQAPVLIQKVGESLNAGDPFVCPPSMW